MTSCSIHYPIVNKTNEQKYKTKRSGSRPLEIEKNLNLGGLWSSGAPRPKIFWPPGPPFW